jgi:tRNA 2-(methylsulfanyl)-N6-isopentenyladenosine37 hydroxylase
MADKLTTLGLRLPSDPRWINIAEKNIGEILIDHAFCEQKAATACINLIVKYSNKEKLVEVLSPVVIEEWSHFQMVIKELKKRGIPLGNKRRDYYVHELNKCKKGGGGDINNQLMEDVLILAMIEARSAERFKLLSEEISDHSLRTFYYELMKSEALHYKNFIELAEEYMPKEIVRKRWEELLIQEAEIMKELEVTPGRLH